MQLATVEVPGPQFGNVVDSTAIPASLLGLSSYSDPIAKSPRVSRAIAIQVPAVKRSRDLIAGSLGGLPLELLDQNGALAPWSLFAQPEQDIPRSVSMAQLFEDLLFEGIAWWRVLAKDYRGYPTYVRRMEPSSVQVQQDGKVYVKPDGTPQGMSWEWVPDANLIRFDSPTDGLLTSGARAIRTCLLLDQAAANHADGAPPLDYFTPNDDVDLVDEDSVPDVLTQWATARKARSTAYVPAALKYNVAGWNPEQLQMAEARQHAVLEIARLSGVNPEDVGVPIATHTYFNAFDRRKTFTDFTLSQYRAAVEDRLSMGDVSPNGYRARIDLDDFFRSDPLSRYQAYAAGLAVGAITHDEIRQAEGKPPLTASETADVIRAVQVPNVPAPKELLPA